MQRKRKGEKQRQRQRHKDRQRSQSEWVRETERDRVWVSERERESERESEREREREIERERERESERDKGKRYPSTLRISTFLLNQFLLQRECHCCFIPFKFYELNMKSHIFSPSQPISIYLITTIVQTMMNVIKIWFWSLPRQFCASICRCMYSTHKSLASSICQWSVAMIRLWTVSGVTVDIHAKKNIIT